MTKFNVAVSSHFQARGGTSLGAGLRACKTLYDNHVKSSMNGTSSLHSSDKMKMNPSALFVILTDGQDNAVPSGVEVAAEIRRDVTEPEGDGDEQDGEKEMGNESESEITIAAVGVGPHVIDKQLEQIVDRKRLYVAVESFKDVAKALVRVVHRACPPTARSWRRDMIEKAMGDKRASDGDNEREAEESKEPEEDEADAEEEEEGEEMMPTPTADEDDDNNGMEDYEQPMASYAPWDGAQTKRGRAAKNKRKQKHKKKGRSHKHGQHKLETMPNKGKQKKYMCKCPCECGSN